MQEAKKEATSTSSCATHRSRLFAAMALAGAILFLVYPLAYLACSNFHLTENRTLWSYRFLPKGIPLVLWWPAGWIESRCRGQSLEIAIRDTRDYWIIHCAQ